MGLSDLGLDLGHGTCSTCGTGFPVCPEAPLAANTFHDLGSGARGSVASAHSIFLKMLSWNP